MPRIGIVGWNLAENSFGITKAYAEYFAQYGDIIVLGPSPRVLPGLDLLVLPGGKDISSHIYGEVPSFYTSEPDTMKEYFLKYTLDKYIEANIPVFGICLGMQQIAVHFGCTMEQHIAHPYSDPKNRGEEVHGLRFLKGEDLLRKGDKNKKQMKVNSLHHQAVNSYSLHSNSVLECIAVSTDEKPEIIKHKKLNIWGVQYHPEELYDWPSHNIISSLLHERDTDQ